MAQTILGSGTFTEQPQRRQKARGRGWITTRTWLGPKDVADDYIVATVLPLNPETVEVVAGTPASIIATFPDSISAISPDPLQEAEDEAIWELIPTVLDKTLATHPAFQQSGQTPTVIESIEKALREGNATETDWDADFGIPNMNDYRNLRVKGMDSYRTWGYTIRKTISVGRAVEVQAEEVNTQKIVKYNEIGLPSDVKWSQPKYRAWDGNIVTIYNIDEWLAGPPQIRYTRKKYEIVKEWLGAYKWYGIIYEGGTAATTADGLN